MSVVHSSDSINLPDPRLESDFSVEQAIQNRRSVRNFSKQPLTLAEVSQLLWSAQGKTGGGGLRSAPSAGALYPLVIYLVAGNVTDLEPGIYQYSPGKHKLLRIKEGDSRKELSSAALKQHWMKHAAAQLVFTAVEKKTTRKYGQRGIRYIHIEVGHSAQNVFLQAQSLGLGAAVVGAFDGSRIEKILNLSAGEQVLYLMPVGRSQTDDNDQDLY
ncbi:MAG: SagB/ThcOx family dehydrogenase [Gammaproteobacteria bacterium]|nr:SagB/ThcOx family dehydrogenase [Gammaproteobacteria bacterium]